MQRKDFLSSSTFVPMVETTDLWDFNHSSHRWGLNKSWNWRILCQTQVRA
jgi:hypothetical protein